MLGGILLLNLLVVGATLLSLHESRQQFDEQAASTTRNLAQAIEQYVDGAVDKIDMALLSVADEAERELASGSLDKAALDAFIARQFARQTDTEALLVTDAAGEVVLGAGVKGAPRVSVADRDYFKRLRDDPAAGLVFSAPLRSRVSGEWILVLARRIQRSGNGFGGIVFAPISIARLQKMFSSVDVGRDGSITLRGEDFGIIARYPLRQKIDAVIGNRRVSAEFKKRMQSGSIGGTFSVNAAFDDVERIFSFRRITGHPLVIIVGVAKKDYLAPWRAQVVERIAYMGLFVLVTLFWAWLMHRVWMRKALAVRLEQQVRERTAQLRALAIELTMVEERERNAIAQDLHDELGQTLAIAKLKLTAVDVPGKSLAHCPYHGGLIAQIKDVEGMINQANRSVRSLSRQLSPPVLHQLGLVPALEWLADEMHDAYRVNVRVHDDGEPKPLDQATGNMLFRAVRELLINVHKHAGTDSADVSAAVHGGHLMISVTDSGRGFDARNKIAPTAGGGFGLFSVSERMGHFGGEMHIDSGHGDGTVVVLILPLAKRMDEVEK